MKAETKTEADNKSLEGGIFYPTGKMLVGVAKLKEAELLVKRFEKAGVGGDRCRLLESGAFREEAEKNLEHPGVLASLGSAVHIRQTQLELAREGCHFLLIDTPDTSAQERNLGLLAGMPVRYAVYYRKLVIEDLVHLIPSTAIKEEAGAPGTIA